ncbi:hypothetical protein SCHPADRAFT_934122 [Schizopora paradoxa]|uniref:Uncharacterized protein n=1 Tax=Schizopora paradoxa TaxID=27342 RepID=A0A0H2R3K0_9AGAM|nr:hypothetical protein SCHPADRAFT_934122 [Schizopora paradoxa]
MRKGAETVLTMDAKELRRHEIYDENRHKYWGRAECGVGRKERGRERDSEGRRIVDLMMLDLSPSPILFIQISFRMNVRKNERGRYGAWKTRRERGEWLRLRADNTHFSLRSYGEAGSVLLSRTSELRAFVLFPSARLQVETRCTIGGGVFVSLTQEFLKIVNLFGGISRVMKLSAQKANLAGGRTSRELADLIDLRKASENSTGAAQEHFEQYKLKTQNFEA